jgi:FMN phosphatase YigB (HAD superfamily)
LPKDIVIEFVYFDLGNILLSFDPALACQGLADRVGASPKEARIALYDSGLEERYEHGQVSSHQFAVEIRQTFELSESEVSDSVIVESTSNMFTPIETMNGVLTSVRNAGFRVGLLSNTCLGHWQWIQQQQFPVMDFVFDALVLSFEVGSMKPDRPIYEAAELAAGVSSDRILFLDDRPENVEAAQSFGWNSTECLGGPQAIEVLKAYHVTDLAH